MHSVIAGLVVLLAAPSCLATESTQWFEGITAARYDLELGFEISGVVEDAPVESGQPVRGGQTILKLRAGDAEAQVTQLRIRSESTHEIDAARAEWELAKVELEQVREARSRGGASDSELRRKELETERSRLAYELFVQRQQETRLQLRQAEVNLERYIIRAPRDGVAELVKVSTGEIVAEQTPVVRFVDLSTLRAEVPIPSRLADGLRVGTPAWVQFGGPESTTSEEARVVQIATVGDPASGLRKVIVELPNPDGRAAGDTVLVSFGGSSSESLAPGRTIEKPPPAVVPTSR
jgi:RND family efflux transporter MFP subunit